MAEQILSIVAKIATGLQCLPCERVNLDAERFGEYRDSDEHPADIPFENPPLASSKKQISEATTPTIFRYFLDGSRRTYKVADLIINGHYYPLVAGQVGVGVSERGSQGKLTPMREYCHFSNVLVFPEIIGEPDLKVVTNAVNEGARCHFQLLKYSLRDQDDLVDLGIAKIMSEMHNCEIAVVEKMANECILTNDNLLVIDGSLRFKKKLDITQFHNVIGLSKTFRPSFTLGKGRFKKDVGTLTAGLEFGERTSAYKTEDEEKIIGMWYLKLRQSHWMSNPLQGIVKIERYATTSEEKENGLDGDRINTISSYLLHERNVTPFRSDGRWASHVYPIYLTELYVKSSFMSDLQFKALF